jgi:hypothetical protein
LFVIPSGNSFVLWPGSSEMQMTEPALAGLTGADLAYQQ